MTDLNAGARIIGVAPGCDQVLSELAGHLILLPSLGADGNDSASARSRGSSPPGSMTAPAMVWSHQTMEQFWANAVTGRVR
jgi:hypothetical protein